MLILDFSIESTARNQRDSLLLRLPSELRNKICALAIGGHTVRLMIVGGKRKRIPDVWFSYEDSEPNSRRKLKDASLNQVCRQLRYETVGLHISLNTFVGSPQELLSFVEWCGKDAVHLATLCIRPYYGISGGAVLLHGHGVFEFSNTARALVFLLCKLPHIERVTLLNAYQQDWYAILFAARLMFGHDHPVELRIEVSALRGDTLRL